MTLQLTRPILGADAPSDILWRSPESGLWVASCGGEFLGMIERREGRYFATDSRGRRCGAFENLTEAQIAVDRMPDQADRDRREVLMLKATVALTSFAATGAAIGLLLLVA